LFSISKTTFLSAAAALALAALPARAQCGPDGLDGGPCCAPAGVVLPQIPGLTQDMRWLCFDTCQPTVNNLYCVQVGTPIPVKQGGVAVCGAYTIRFKASVCGTPTVLWNGLTRAHYSRTWLESTSAGTVLQVWRFLVNGDFAPTANVPMSPCDRPACLGTYNRIYFTGYIDYAFDCATGNWEFAFGLTHECDGIHHDPSSWRPAPATGLHPTRSFTMVSPGAAFVAASTAPIQSDGPIFQQAMRWNNWALSPNICTFEEPCQGNFFAQNQFCMCLPAVATPQYISSFVNAMSVCGSSVNPSPLGMFLQKRIGGWTNPGAFPGNEFLLFDIGWLDYTNACTGLFSNEWFEGVETIDGYPAFDFTGGTLGRQFEDVESCNQSPTSMAIKIGAPHVPYYVLNFNML
jgi:hypothetical protein